MDDKLVITAVTIFRAADKPELMTAQTYFGHDLVAIYQRGHDDAQEQRDAEGYSWAKVTFFKTPGVFVPEDRRTHEDAQLPADSTPADTSPVVSLTDWKKQQRPRRSRRKP